MKKMDKGDFDKILEEGRKMIEEENKNLTSEQLKAIDEGLDILYARWQQQGRDIEEITEEDE